MGVLRKALLYTGTPVTGVRRPMETATPGAGDKRAKWEEMADFRNIKWYCQTYTDPVPLKINAKSMY